MVIFEIPILFIHQDIDLNMRPSSLQKEVASVYLNIPHKHLNLTACGINGKTYKSALKAIFLPFSALIPASF